MGESCINKNKTSIEGCTGLHVFMQRSDMAGYFGKLSAVRKENWGKERAGQGHWCDCVPGVG